MLRSVALKTLHDYRRSLVWWALGVAAFVALYAAIYPTVRDMPDIDELLDSYPEALRAFIGASTDLDFSSPEGYLQTEAFSFLLPLLFLIFGIGAGAAAIAGEEERGTMELLLAQPVSRRRVVLEKVAAITGAVALLAAVLWLALWLGALAAGMEISAGRLAAATVSLLLLALVFTMLTLLLGAATGNRVLAIGTSAALALLAYVVDSLAVLVDALETVQPLSPFYLYRSAEPLRDGLDPVHALVLLALAAACAALAAPAFDRRDARL
jgi:ABC-2 type transport system permease protein